MEDGKWVVHDLVRAAGLNRSYAGYRYLVCTLELIREEPERLELLTKWVYPEVARRFGVAPSGVDRALRTAEAVCWRRGPWERTGRSRDEEPPPPLKSFLEHLLEECPEE